MFTTGAADLRGNARRDTWLDQTSTLVVVDHGEDRWVSNRYWIARQDQMPTEVRNREPGVYVVDRTKGGRLRSIEQSDIETPSELGVLLDPDTYAEPVALEALSEDSPVTTLDASGRMLYVMRRAGDDGARFGINAAWLELFTTGRPDRFVYRQQEGSAFPRAFVIEDRDGLVYGVLMPARIPGLWNPAALTAGGKRGEHIGGGRRC